MLSALILAAAIRLPTGVFLDPATPTHPVGSMPLGVAVSGDRAVLLLSGWREQGLQVVEISTGRVLQTLEQPAAFIGVAFAPDGKTLWASGGNEDAVYRYDWRNAAATAAGRIELALKDPRKGGTRYPAGLAFSPDGKRLYVAENLSDTVAVIDVAASKVIQHIRTDRYPYAIAVARNGDVYVSSWGDNTVVHFRPRDGMLNRRRRITVARHPSAMLLDRNRLYVASAKTDRVSVIDLSRGTVVATLHDPPPGGVREGSTPNALAISADGKRLFVAEADANAVAVFEVQSGGLVGRIPTDWYPAALAVIGNKLMVVAAKGRGTAPNPTMVQADRETPPRSRQHTLGQLDGSVMMIPVPADLTALTRRVVEANGWNRQRSKAAYPPFRHVLYVIKENRTYDQVLGDLEEGDGDPSLVFFPRQVSPNHHALAERFGLFDRFFVNAEVSADGHNWSTAAYVTDYVTKVVPSDYSGRGRTYDYEGTNRGQIVDDDDDVAAPAAGYLWDLAVRKGITLRDYGEYVHDGVPARRSLIGRTNLEYPGWDLDVPDQKRADIWIADLGTFIEKGDMPALQILRLPNDHTAGGRAGKPTPRAYMADNDLALGRIVEALSHSPFWKDTVMFVLEDDAQDGPDHVDSHRSPLFVISPYNGPGVIHRFANTTDVLATIEEILGLDSLSHFDRFGRALREVFAVEPDLRPYSAVVPAVDLNERNPEGDKKSALLNLKRDADDEDTFNRILWSIIKGEAPYPGPTRAPLGGTLESGRPARSRGASRPATD